MRLISVFLPIVLLGSDPWPQWRGPARDGFASAFSAPASWPKTLALQWKIDAGEGYSSPVVSENLVCLHSRRGDEEVVSCHDRASGRLVWTDRYISPFQGNRYATQMSRGPYATPLIAAGRLFTVGVNAVVSAYDLSSGKLAWRRQPAQTPSTGQLFCGTAVSPLFDDGRLFVYWGDDLQGGEVLALDPATGKTQWSWKGEGPGYGSLVPASIGGSKQIIAFSDRTLFALSPGDGRLLWKTPFPDEWHENSVTPVVAGDLVIVSGARANTHAFRVQRASSGWQAEKIWTSTDAPMYMSTPLVDGKYLYGLSSRNKGQLFCLEIATGRTVWLSEGRVAEHASLVAAGPDVLVMAADGRAWPFKRTAGHYLPGPTYELAAAAVYAHPALAGKQIFVKDANSLKAYTLP